MYGKLCVYLRCGFGARKNRRTTRTIFERYRMKKKTKELVYLRSRPRKDGTQALFLRATVNGTRKDEYLKLYLVPERTKADREKNRETLALAESIKAQRIVELQQMKFGIDAPIVKDVLFYDYMQTIIDRKDGTTKTSWQNCRAHLLRYEPNMKLKIGDITPRWVQGFRDYLDEKAMQWAIDDRKRDVEPKPIAQGTKALMFQKLCTVFNLAVKEGVLARNPSLNVERFKEPESDREFLSVEEMRHLATVPAPSEVLGRAFFFSCLTGLRWSDIEKLTWHEVQKVGDVTRIVFKQKKTRSQEYLDINDQAVALMGDRGEDSARVFPGLGAIQQARIGIAAWVKSAGINKHITFHCARHSFAIMMLDAGVDLYTLSKLMGHKSIESTQIYAKILDKHKQAAITRIPKIF